MVFISKHFQQSVFRSHSTYRLETWIFGNYGLPTNQTRYFGFRNSTPNCRKAPLYKSSSKSTTPFYSRIWRFISLLHYIFSYAITLHNMHCVYIVERVVMKHRFYSDLQRAHSAKFSV